VDPCSRFVGAPSATARPAAAAPRRALWLVGGAPPANGLPQALSASPHCAIAHVESSRATAWNAPCPSSHQNECSNVIACSKSFCAAALQEMGNTTRPSFAPDPPCSFCAASAEASRHVANEARLIARVI